jgi:hypothetical protein
MLWAHIQTPYVALVLREVAHHMYTRCVIQRERRHHTAGSTSVDVVGSCLGQVVADSADKTKFRLGLRPATNPNSISRRPAVRELLLQVRRFPTPRVLRCA